MRNPLNNTGIGIIVEGKARKNPSKSKLASNMAFLEKD